MGKQEPLGNGDQLNNLQYIHDFRKKCNIDSSIRLHRKTTISVSDNRSNSSFYVEFHFEDTNYRGILLHIDYLWDMNSKEEIKNLESEKLFSSYSSVWQYFTLDDNTLTVSNIINGTTLTLYAAESDVI